MSMTSVAVLAMVAGSWSTTLAAQGLDPHQTSQAIDDVHYTVTFDSSTAAGNVIHVAMRFMVQSDEPVVLSLPAWTPGSYELDHFARYVSGFRASSSGRPLKIDKLDFDVPPANSPRPPGAEDFHHGFLDGISARVVRGPSRPVIAVFLLQGSEDPVEKAISTLLQNLFQA